ncbi:hypothetical protein SSAG_03864 [Streptomyces sp. Mg1]|nr:hypothetical protein SSAG_03864 [Streptomyces sp. Mg1]
MRRPVVHDSCIHRASPAGASAAPGRTRSTAADAPSGAARLTRPPRNEAICAPDVSIRLPCVANREDRP